MLMEQTLCEVCLTNATVLTDALQQTKAWSDEATAS